MRKTLAISLIGAVLAAPLSAQAPNPCDVFGRTSLSDGIHQFSDLPRIHREESKSFARDGVYVPSLGVITKEELARAMGVVGPADWLERNSSSWHVTIPGTDRIEFSMGIVGTLRCVWYELFRTEAGMAHVLEGPEYDPESYCPGTAIRPILIEGRAYLYAYVEGDPAKPAWYRFHTIGSDGASEGPVCRLRLNWVEAGRFEGHRNADRNNLEPFRPALAALDARRAAIMQAARQAAIDAVAVFGLSARALPASPGRTQTLFEADGLAFVIETPPLRRGIRPVFTLHRVDTGARIEIVENNWRRVAGYTVR